VLRLTDRKNSKIALKIYEEKRSVESSVEYRANVTADGTSWPNDFKAMSLRQIKVRQPIGHVFGYKLLGLG